MCSDSLLSILLSRSCLLTALVRRSAQLRRQELSRYFSCVRNAPLECPLVSPLTDPIERRIHHSTGGAMTQGLEIVLRDGNYRIDSRVLAALEACKSSLNQVQ
jgi:hypothetical protein